MVFQLVLKTLLIQKICPQKMDLTYAKTENHIQLQPDRKQGSAPLDGVKQKEQNTIVLC